ncbi:sensor histidine kinase [Thermoguttaceae bacterium LCP21S3_D4]
MKSFNRLIAGVLIFLLTGILGVNIYWNHLQEKETEKLYRVEIERVTEELREKVNPAGINYDAYQDIRSVTVCKGEADVNRVGKYPVCIRQINGTVYRIEYEEEDKTVRRQERILINGIFLLTGGLLLCVLVYIRKRIIKPFHVLEEVPVELSKGNLSVPLQEQKTKYFGKFIWGMNLLREKLEERRRRELKFHREQKMKLLSLTHDIKTPLSVIKLNAQALEKGLYQDAEKRQQAAGNIYQKTVEIDDYLATMNELSKDDFLELKVDVQEVYLSEVLETLRRYYKDKLSQLHIGFNMGEYQNFLVKADTERLLEVLQNIIENAIKYGSGKKIGISISKEEDCVLITVENTGEVLPAEELPHLFDSFYRGSNAGSQEGSGLGLYICRKLMHKMNGDVFLKQEENLFSVTVVVGMAN